MPKSLSQLLTRIGLPTDIASLIGPMILAVVTAVALIGGLVTGSSQSPIGPGLSSALGIVHETQQPPADVEQRDNLENEKEIRWSRYQREDAQQSVRVFFQAGTPTCYGQRATVTETERTVTIRVYEGTVPGAPDSCTADAMYASLLVELDAPLGNRRLLK